MFVEIKNKLCDFRYVSILFSKMDEETAQITLEELKISKDFIRSLSDEKQALEKVLRVKKCDVLNKFV